MHRRFITIYVMLEGDETGCGEDSNDEERIETDEEENKRERRRKNETRIIIGS